MPAYQFICDECGKIFERNFKFSERQVNVKCPVGHVHVHKMFTTPTVVFKGSGFYITDHRKAAAPAKSQ